jgi:hypothetical protein
VKEKNVGKGKRIDFRYLVTRMLDIKEVIFKYEKIILCIWVFKNNL